MASEGRQDSYLGHDGGYLFDSESLIGRHMRKEMHKAFEYYGFAGTIPVYLEQGVFNFYLEKGDHTIPSSPPGFPGPVNP